MAIPGYSGTPLIKKLGIRPGMRVRLINAPPDYFDLIGQDIRQQVVKNGNADFVHLFARTKKELHGFSQLITELPTSAVIWVSWYKKSSKIPTDVTEDAIRETVLPMGWVDVKVCAVSEIWSGLKIVTRKTNR